MKPRTIVHIALDDKFIDMGINEFEAVAPGINFLVLLGRVRALQHVRHSNVHFLSISETVTLVNRSEVAAVVFHSLDQIFLPVLDRIRHDRTVIWLGWGYDYYDRLLMRAFPEGLLLPGTRELQAAAPRPSAIRRFTLVAKSAAKRLLGRSVPFSPRLLERVDYFAPVIETEYQLAQTLNPGLRARYIDWNYGIAEMDFGCVGGHADPIGEDVLLGNSATPENNHIEAIELIASCVNLDGRKVVVPLSYGEAWYRDEVIKFGRRLLGDRFVPLIKFMEKQAYSDVVRSCGYLVMNHLRQQALGNIVMGMASGSRIYMNSANPLYLWLCGKGAHIESIESLARDAAGKKISLAALSPVSQRDNSRVVQAHWGLDAKHAKTRRLVDAALLRDGPELDANHAPFTGT